jgi:hypothetical protein
MANFKIIIVVGIIPKIGQKSSIRKKQRFQDQQQEIL